MFWICEVVYSFSLHSEWMYFRVSFILVKFRSSLLSYGIIFFVEEKQCSYDKERGLTCIIFNVLS